MLDRDPKRASDSKERMSEIAPMPAATADGPRNEQMLALDDAVSSPVTIDSIELLRFGGTYLVRSSCTDGAFGLAVTTPHISYLHPILTERVAPFFIGQDARELEALIDGVYLHQGNYKLTGLPFWCCVAAVEFSLIDLLGKVAHKPASAFLGGSLRKQVPVYLSLLGRDMTPAAAVERLSRRLDETGTRAVKVKIGGRMSDNADAYPGRTEELVPLLRRELGDDVAIYVDANGSYDARRAIEVGRLLEANGVGFFEEPCPFECYDQTRRVAEALAIPIAGGEQDSSLVRWHQMLSDRVVDLPQPDLVHIGGFLRTARVTAMAAAQNLPVSLHNPRTGPTAAYMLQFVSATPNVAADHEFDAVGLSESWYEPQLRIHGGVLDVPAGPGLGIIIDPAVLKRAERIKRVRRFARVIRSMFRG
jgi:L-alanine-DL-glutamate epimerase-like enolase superfamily enzyme